MKKLSIPLSAAIALSSVIFLLFVALFLYPAVFAGIDAVDGTALSNHHDSLLTETDNGIVYTAYKNVYALENTAKVKERSMANAMDYYRIRASEIGLNQMSWSPSPQRTKKQPFSRRMAHSFFVLCHYAEILS